MTASPSQRPNPLAITAVVIWTGLLVLLSHWMGQQAYHWLPVQASTAAPLVDGLFSFETAIGTFVFAGVLSVITWVVVRHRAEKYDESDASPVEGNTRLEVVWTAIPFVLVMAIAFHAIQVNSRLGVLGPMEHIHSSSDPMIGSAAQTANQTGQEVIDVVARQWSWEFRYPQAAVNSTELHLAVDQPVSFRLRSEDVLHGFYIPAFRLKQDVVPGRDITFRLTPNREGRYRLRDSQFSGTWFAANQADVVVESKEQHQRWLKNAAQSALQPGLSAAAEDIDKRGDSPVRGWATVQPAPAPLVNVAGSRNAPHDG